MVSKFKGCLIGLACGDYLGMPVEFMQRSQVFQFFGERKLKPLPCHHRAGTKPPGFYTDDTSLTICLCESLLEKGFDVKDQFQKYRKWYMTGYGTPFEDKAFGIGQTTLKMLISLDENNLPDKLEHKEQRGGNGALMRSAPIGLLYYQDEKEIKDKSIASVIVTHNNLFAAWSCIVLNSFISYCLHGIDKSNFVKKFISKYNDCPPELIKILIQDFSFLDEMIVLNTGYSLHTLNIALYSFFTTDNYEDCITKAIFVGGDTDTQAAIAGALAGAYYGVDDIPQNWVKTLIRKDYIEDLAVRLYNECP
ncbi:MAG: ADP-ribosylglycohydrolase family protein [Candidatus Daviesbacteria bacterium]|nr:ADP-ribosylglycohydrolase family protein [Candidatus Daviesbacteria bacterium]